MIAIWVNLGLLDGASRTDAEQEEQTQRGGGNRGASWDDYRRRLKAAQEDEERRLAEVAALDAAAKLQAVQDGLDRFSSALDNDDAADNQREAIALRLARLRAEASAASEWQRQIAAAAVMYEFRQFMASIAMAADEEDAILALLFA